MASLFSGEAAANCPCTSTDGLATGVAQATSVSAEATATASGAAGRITAVKLTFRIVKQVFITAPYGVQGSPVSEPGGDVRCSIHVHYRI